MKTLSLKHNGHEAHVPYELPDSLTFECFVPEEGTCIASLDVRADVVTVNEVHRRHESGGSYLLHDILPESFDTHPAVLEQAGDVCAVFERALNAQRVLREPIPLVALVTRRDEDDALVLSTIAEMALLESDLHTAWGRLPASVRPSGSEPPDPRTPEESHAHLALQRWIEHVLVPRAQDLATAAAKRREAAWEKAGDARCEHCDGSGEGRCGGRCPCCSGRGRSTARLTGFAGERA